MPEKIIVAECRLREAMSEHFKEHGSQGSYKVVYSKLPTAFDNMTHSEILEVANAIFDHAVASRDIITKSILQPLITTSKVLLGDVKITDYIND